MKNIESWRWSQIILLLAVPGLLIVIIGGLIAKLVPMPFGTEFSTIRTVDTNSTTANGFTTVFSFTENIPQAIDDYHQEFSQTIGWMVVGGLSFLYGAALFIYSLIVPVKLRRILFVGMAVYGLSLLGFGQGGLKFAIDSNGPLVRDCIHLQNAYDSKQYQITEGLVQVARSQGKTDNIQVGNIPLEINYYVSLCAYKQNIMHGGFLTEGAYARVYYIDYKTILRIDIKNP